LLSGGWRCVSACVQVGNRLHAAAANLNHHRPHVPLFGATFFSTGAGAAARAPLAGAATRPFPLAGRIVGVCVL